MCLSECKSIINPTYKNIKKTFKILYKNIKIIWISNQKNKLYKNVLKLQQQNFTKNIFVNGK